MTDFDDEPTTGRDETADDWDDEPAPRPKRKPKPKAKPEPVEDDWDDDWDDEAEPRKGRDLTVVYAVVAATIVIVLTIVFVSKGDDSNDNASNGSTAAPTQVEGGPIEKNWQGPVADGVGADGVDAKARAASGEGVYIWTDFQGWHVRSNGPDEVTVVVAAPEVRAKATDDYDDSDETANGDFKTEETVTIPAGDGSQGAGFDLGQSETATFTVTVGGQNVAAETIKLGGKDGQASENPVTFNKA